MLPRSYLFVPGDRPERIAKARGSGADAVIVDLEDAVAPAGKGAARDAVAGALDAAQPVLLRINGADTTWFDDDARLAAHPGVAAVVLPKAGSADDVASVRAAAVVLPKADSAGAVARVRALCGKPVLALVETAAGMAGLEALAAAEGVARLAFGSIDFSARSTSSSTSTSPTTTSRCCRSACAWCWPRAWPACRRRSTA